MNLPEHVKIPPTDSAWDAPQIVEQELSPYQFPLPSQSRDVGGRAGQRARARSGLGRQQGSGRARGRGRGGPFKFGLGLVGDRHRLNFRLLVLMFN